MESLLYLEFNILYNRTDSIPDWTNIIKHKDGSYTAEYIGNHSLNLDMVVHSTSMIDNILTIRKLSLSDLYSRYEYMNESMEIMEDISIEYYRFIFHTVTKNYYLKRYVSNSEQLSLLNFIETKSDRYSEATQRYLKEIIRNSDEECNQ